MKKGPSKFSLWGSLDNLDYFDMEIDPHALDEWLKEEISLPQPLTAVKDVLPPEQVA